MRALSVVKAEAESLGKKAFLAKNAHPFLVLATPAADETPAFASTAVVPLEILDGETDEVALTQASPPTSSLLDDPGAIAFEVVKSDRNPFADMITIGRAKTNDIVIDAMVISKVHAVIQAEGAGWVVGDHKSTNGTCLDGRRLAPTERAALVDGSRITLAPGVSLGFWTAEGLFSLLAGR